MADDIEQVKTCIARDPQHLDSIKQKNKKILLLSTATPKVYIEYYIEPKHIWTPLD